MRRLMKGQVDDVKEWKLIWESGKTSEEIVATDKIDVSGYEELFVVCRTIPSENNASARNGVVIVEDDEGKQHQMTVGELVASSGNARMSATFLQKIDNLLVSQSAVSVNGEDIFETGYAASNLSRYNTAIAVTSSMKSIIISNTNRLSSYVFGTGSDFHVYAR